MRESGNLWVNTMKSVFIEMLGPGGVGKTFLMEAAVGHLALKYKHRNNLKGKVEFDSPSAEILYRLWKERINEMDSWNHNPIKKLKLAEYWCKVINRDLLAREKSEKSNIFFDEGIAQIFGSRIPMLHQRDIDVLLKGRALIFVLPRDNQTVAEQIIKRTVATGYTNPAHVRTDIKSLIKMTEKSMSNFNLILACAEEHHIPHLVLWAEDEVHSNIEKMVAFERQLIG